MYVKHWCAGKQRPPATVWSGGFLQGLRQPGEISRAVGVKSPMHIFPSTVATAAISSGDGGLRVESPSTLRVQDPGPVSTRDAQKGAGELIGSGSRSGAGRMQLSRVVFEID